MGKRAERKKFIRSLLANRDLDCIRSWAALERNPDKVVMGSLFDPDPLIRWRAIEAFGEVAVFFSQASIEKVRFVIRNLFWIMNDESGGLGWNAPEAIGQIIVRLPKLAPEYNHLLANFIVEEPFERGTHWALSQIAHLKPDAIDHRLDDMIKAVEDPDPYIRAYTAVTLPYLNVSNVGALIASLRTDSTALDIYDTSHGQYTGTTVAEMASRGLELIKSAG